MTQLTLEFMPAALVRMPGLAATARKMGDSGAGHAHGRAERAAPDFSARAQAFVLQYLQAHGVSSGELVTDAAKLSGIKPPDDRAFGAVYAALARRNAIRCVGYCARVKGHGTAGGRLWAVVA